MQKQQIPLKNSLFLLLAAIIWGIAFVAQSVGMEYVGGFTFSAVRSLLGSVVLIPLILISGRKNSANTAATKANSFVGSSDGTVSSIRKRKDLIIGGISCGICLCLASNFQQFGIKYTTVGKAGFITALYIVIVPILGIFLKRKVNLKIWISVLIALVGLYLLCMSGSLTLTKGDALILLGALFFSFHILVVDYFSSKVSGVKLSCIQLFIASMLSAIPMFVLENPKLSSICAAWAPILYAGILSCGVAYTLQIIGQRNLNPTIASLILSLESVISVLAGWVILHQTLSTRELIGCVLMFAAILLAEL